VIDHHLRLGHPLAAASRAAHDRLRAHLAEALGALRGIPVVALKGPLLGERLYPDPRARPSTDLDLLVAPAELDRAAAALATAGWRAPTTRAEAWYRRHHHHLHLERAGAPVVELHFRAATAFGADLDAAPLLARARPHDSGALVLAPEDEWLYLAVHAANHRFERLGWLYDLKLLARTRPTWDVVLARAAEAGVSRAVAFALALVRERLHADVPAAAGSRLAWRLLDEPWAGPAFRVALCDRPSAAARMLARKALLRLYSPRA
jgi:hypothetical protein